jgi:hypothetical protein
MLLRVLVRAVLAAAVIFGCVCAVCVLCPWPSPAPAHTGGRSLQRAAGVGSERSIPLALRLLPDVRFKVFMQGAQPRLEIQRLKPLSGPFRTSVNTRSTVGIPI